MDSTIINNEIFKIMCVIVLANRTYLVANQINDRAVSNTDKYLPKKTITFGMFFWFYKKDEPVRWTAYWIERITQILMFIYIVIVIRGNNITGTWEFMTAEFQWFWIAIMFFYPLLFEISVDIYVFFKGIGDKRDSS